MIRAGSRASAASALCALAITSCAFDDREGSAFAVRDSAGIEIVEFDRDRLGQAWSVDPEAEWIVGNGQITDEELVLYGVNDAVLLEDDVLVIAEGSTEELIRVHLDSGTVERWGGTGDGPGEFRGLFRVYDAGDGRIGVFDPIRRRYVEFDGRRTIVEERAIPEVGQRGGGLHLERSGAGELYLAAVTALPTTSTEGPQRGVGPVARLSESIDTLTSIRGKATFATQEIMAGVLFGPTTVVAGGRSGLWVGDTEERQVKLWQNSGQPQRIVRWTSDESRELSGERVNRFWENFEEALSADERGMLSEMRDVWVLADSVPAFGSLLAGPAGTLWVGSFLPPEIDMIGAPRPAQDWLVVDPEAGRAGTATTPEGLQVLQIGEDFIMGVHSDDLGVETVRRYGLAAGPSDGGQAPGGERAAGNDQDECTPLSRSAEASLEGFLPSGWEFERTAFVDAPDRVREWDGAPATYVAARVLDDEGNRAGDGPALWLVEGGTTRKHDERPKGYYVLNDLAAELTDRRYEEAEDENRRRTPDARAASPPYSETDPAVLKAVECLTGESL